ncbi:hypothetical protein [Dictyobacter formicarum]|uniref:hypothetical protein n=1 Tax=Dictyobacter formicarum TaxID=2778368 RepID=UPI0019161187|nr:hypothetical protein [Dictyobacter formicarum]
MAALSPEPVDALRTLFLSDQLARPLDTQEHLAGLWDRQATCWIVFDIAGTREAARQRALPRTQNSPLAHRRLRPLCAPASSGRWIGPAPLA